MDDQDLSAAMLNVYEVEADGRTRHLLCFLEPARAQATGIDPRAVVGELAPGEAGEFDPDSIALNPEFVEAFTGYMNDESARSPDLVREATRHANGWLYVLDPRFGGGEDDEPPPGDLLGCYAVDGAGRIVPNSFLYNDNHALFDRTSGVSAVLYDRRFYEWLHPAAEGSIVDESSDH